MDDPDSEWQRKGATLSDKTARKEFGLTQDEVVQAIRAGKLHYREASMHGNPWLRLLRREVEALVKKKHGDDYLKDQRAKTELAGINRKLKQMKTQIAALEERKEKLKDDAGAALFIDDAKEELLAETLEDLPESEPLIVFAVFHHELDAIRRVAEKQKRRFSELSGRRNDLKL
jgi:hypothetical protein